MPLQRPDWLSSRYFDILAGGRIVKRSRPCAPLRDRAPPAVADRLPRSRGRPGQSTGLSGRRASFN